MASSTSIVVISENEPTEFVTGDVILRKLRPEYYLWVNPTSGDIKRWNPDTETWTIIPVQSHAANHEDGGIDRINQLGTVHFKGKVYAGSGDTHEGITQEIVLSEGTLSVKKGIVVGWTPV